MFIRKHIILFKPYFIHVVFLLRNKLMHARGILFREAFSGGGASRKAFREKTPRGYRKGTDSPLARKAFREKGK
jgi:hypothetical protein